MILSPFTLGNSGIPIEVPVTTSFGTGYSYPLHRKDLGFPLDTGTYVVENALETSPSSFINQSVRRSYGRGQNHPKRFGLPAF